jgi:beta-phosphoglucomutase-like phosphatase (HAD superfamily)
LIDEAFAAKIPVSICSTSNELAVRAIATSVLGADRVQHIQIFAGDMVAKKKPAPDIYLMAAKAHACDPTKCWVVEDSEIGLRAAKAAMMKCVVTKSIYTAKEDFQHADFVVDDLNKGGIDLAILRTK